MVKPWDPAEPNSIECLQVVYKVAERCNINCSYCYYFNMGDQTALDRPTKASVGSAEKLARWIANGCAEQQIPRVNISFHGGEPMLVKPREFEAICRAFRNAIEPVAEVLFAIQTNGTIFNAEWMRIFSEQRVSVGISIDGDRLDHDRYRLDHRGRSTFDQTMSTIEQLLEAGKTHPWLHPSTISVMDPRVDYSATYRFLRGLGVRQMHFLLPDRNVDDRTAKTDEDARALGRGLLDVFTEWMIEDDQSVDIRFIHQALGYFKAGRGMTAVPRRRKTNQIIVARTDGTVAIDDSYIPALDWYSAVPDFPIDFMSLREVLGNSVFRHIEVETNRLPSGCASCVWRHICRGGDLENRFSKETGFDNPSVYCETYKTLYSGICHLLVENGYPEEEILRRFGELHYV